MVVTYQPTNPPTNNVKARDPVGSKYTEKGATSPVVDTFQNESDQLEAQEGDDEDGLVVLQLGDVGVERVAEQHAVLHDDDEVEQELPDQSGHVLQRLRPGKQEGIHSVRGNKCQITVYVFHQIRCIFMRNFYLFSYKAG